MNYMGIAVTSYYPMFACIAGVEGLVFLSVVCLSVFLPFFGLFVHTGNFQGFIIYLIGRSGEKVACI